MTIPPITMVPLSSALGAEVRGVDLAHPMDVATARAIRAAWLEHLVLLFRNQRLNPAQLVAFSRRFGPLDIAPPNENGQRAVADHPEVLIISNVIEDGVPIGSLGAGEAAWHSDMSYLEHPPVGSVLYALEVPKTGGDTAFANLYHALEALPESLRREIDSRRLKHDASTNSAGYLRQGAEPVKDVATSPGAFHPVVRRHPESGRFALFLGRRALAYVEGLPVAVSEALLDRLWSHAMEERFTWSHRWHRGDLLMWDNRCVMHRRDAFDPSMRRLMHRTQIGQC